MSDMYDIIFQVNTRITLTVIINAGQEISDTGNLFLSVTFGGIACQRYSFFSYFSSHKLCRRSFNDWVIQKSGKCKLEKQTSSIINQILQSCESQICKIVVLEFLYCSAAKAKFLSLVFALTDDFSKSVITGFLDLHVKAIRRFKNSDRLILYGPRVMQKFYSSVTYLEIWRCEQIYRRRRLIGQS